MEIQQILENLDHLMFDNTEKHLSDLQKTIIIGTLTHKKYKTIAEEKHISEDHIKKIASELWQQLGTILGENINKNNLQWAIERIYNRNVSNSIFNINSVNHCSNIPNYSEISLQNNQENNEIKYNENLREIPYQNSFYGRTEELTYLSNKIVDQNCRLVTILGVKGIGKTAFTIKLIEQIKTNFSYFIYRSLNTKPTLTEITQDIIKLISPELINNLNINNENEISLLKYYLTNHCYLIILDDLQEIFTQGKLAGNYQSNYQNYYKLFKIMTEFSSQSCLILVSQELPLEMANFSEDNPNYSSLILTGLGKSAREILTEKQLLDQHKWEDLINFYEGNPLYLKIIAKIINELFAGKVEDFLEYAPPPFLDESIKVILQQKFNKITEQEREILKTLAQEKAPISLTQLKTLLEIPDLLNNLQSLQRQNLINKPKIDNQIVFEITIIWREYLINLI